MLNSDIFLFPNPLLILLISGLFLLYCLSSATFLLHWFNVCKSHMSCYFVLIICRHPNTPPNTPQHACIAAQSQERDNCVLDSPQCHHPPRLSQPLPRGVAQPPHLTQNMCLGGPNAPQEEKDFAKWLLDVGNGRNIDPAQNIKLPDSMKLPQNTVDCLLNTLYPGISTLPADQQHDQYFLECTILSAHNDDVDQINQMLLDKMPVRQLFFTVQILR